MNLSRYTQTYDFTLPSYVCMYVYAKILWLDVRWITNTRFKNVSVRNRQTPKAKSMSSRLMEIIILVVRGLGERMAQFF